MAEHRQQNQRGQGCGAVQYYNQFKLDRRLLRNPRELLVKLRNREHPFAPAGDFVTYIVTMCQHAGIHVSVEDFLFYRHTRWIRGKRHGLHRERAKVTSGQLFVMYVELRRGETPALFVEILRARGYVPRTDSEAVVCVKRAIQLGLGLDVASKPVVP